MNETCAETRELAPELALGAISGPERARVLGHLSSCVDCRLFVEELTEAADALLLLSPDAEPPLGFESKVLKSMASPRRSFRRLTALLAAAVIASAGTWAGFQLTHRPDPITKEYVATLRALGGQSLRAARLTTGQTVVGHALLYEGRPSWIFVDVAHAGDSGILTINAQLSDGSVVQVGGVRMNDGRGSWGGTLSIQVDSIDAVTIVDASGSRMYRAQFKHAE
ncbi:MAG: zf-HC2 domain-containing protein [Actinobacteria bacterium]|nr:zf-HC2 domain-containing protein [Actinomycetota bacterium]